MNVARCTRNFAVSLAITVAFAQAGDAEDISARATKDLVAKVELHPGHDGREVTMIFKITDTQLIAGERDGTFPHVMLHYEGMQQAPSLGVYAESDLADALHRFALVAPDDRFLGRTIKATGRISTHYSPNEPNRQDRGPFYQLHLRDWSRFRILPDTNVNAYYPILCGIGAALKIDKGRFYVTAIVPKSAAAQSDSIHIGDEMVAVATKTNKFVSFEGKSMGDVVSLLRGPVGTSVVVRMVPKGDTRSRNVELERQPLEVPGVSQNTSYAEHIGQAIPDIELTRLNDTGETIRISKCRGSVVVLDFWASWCGACFPAIDGLQRLKQANPHWNNKVNLFTVTVDEDLATATMVAEKRKWIHTENFSLDQKSFSSLGVQVIPAIIVIAPDGRIEAMAGAYALNVENCINGILQDKGQVDVRGSAEK